MIDKRLEELHLTKDNVLNTYFDLTKKELDLKSIDPFLIIKHFRNNKHELRQYQEGTDRFNEAMGSIANISEYERLNLSDKMIFLGNINVLVNDINAYELVLRFKGVFSYVKEVLNSKDNYMEAYKLKSKQIKALEREKNAIDRQLYSLMRRKKLNKTSKSKVNLINNSLRAYSVKLADKIDEIDAKGNQASNKEIDTRETLLLCLEMTARGLYFKNIDIEKSDATKFVITEDNKGLIIPFRALDGLGENVADGIVKARQQAPFISQEDLQKRGKCPSSAIEKLKSLGVLDNLSESNQMSLF